MKLQKILFSLLLACLSLTALGQDEEQKEKENEGPFINTGIGGITPNGDYGNGRHGILSWNLIEAGYEFKDFGLEGKFLLIGVGYEDFDNTDTHTSFLLGGYWFFNPGIFFLKAGSGLGFRSSEYEFPNGEEESDTNLELYLKLHPGVELGDHGRLGLNTILNGPGINFLLTYGYSF